ncbi:hypothetical protein [Streptomyces sediminimaris]|uniref:hypothetical protein n=1 Tax=Streptomyces sediminimaris TaxID=3383721 RepID=UPI00399B9CDF
MVAAPRERLAGLRDGILATLRERGDTVLECLMPLLRGVAEALPAAEWGMAGLDGIARDCAYRLREVCERPSRAADDWSVAWDACGCELCGVLGAFLGSRSRRVLEWPLAKEGRRHVHTRIDSAELPVRHQTRRQGRPYTLVLTKTQELFTREQAVRSQAAADLAWLMSLRTDDCGFRLGGLVAQVRPGRRARPAADRVELDAEEVVRPVGRRRSADALRDGDPRGCTPTKGVPERPASCAGVAAIVAAAAGA